MGPGKKSGMPEYYRTTYESWYGWLSYVYDPFVRSMLFLINGGFGGERRLRQQAIDWLAPGSGERILDICSGTGTLTIMIGKQMAGQGEVVGVEVSPAQLRVARKKRRPAGVSFVQADAQDIPLPDAGFDKAIIFGALHELPREVRRKVLSEAFRVLKPSGGLVVTEHNNPDSKWKRSIFAFGERFNPEYPTYKDMLECGVLTEIENAGFRVIKTRTAAWDFFQTILAQKQVR
ncbi:MAG: methyltransferase domain-containing protein [Candidatus Eisenbacteria bacterium]